MSPAAGSHAAPGNGRLGAGEGPPEPPRPADAAGNAKQAVIRARHAASKARLMAEGEAQRARLVRDLFAQPVHDYLCQTLGRPLVVLRAGRQTPIEELGLDQLRASGYEVSVTTVDEDYPGARAALGTPAGGTADTPASGGPASGGPVILGDLRSVPLPPRSFEVMYCGFLLDRIPHAALVLDRFGAALRPGGLLLLRIRDRNCAAAALDRRTPEPLRRILWARLHAGEPGPFPAIYDPVSSARGMQAYASAHGLVIIRRETARTATGPPGRLSGTVDAARAMIAWLSRGRLTDQFARLV